METKKVAQRVGNHTAPKCHGLANQDTQIISEYERGALWAGLAMALTFGLCAIHWAVF